MVDSALPVDYPPARPMDAVQVYFLPLHPEPGVGG
tara:strand:- start:15453 stop:15557 length:105 start_codon:yes stop_codon:yes gene_type:complete